MNQITAVLDGLKQKIDHGSTFIQRKYNEIGQGKFNLPAPVTAESLAVFEAEFNQKLPSEYQTFLELHDGADLFILDDGLGLVLYSLDKVIESTIEAKEDGLIDEDFDYFWVIGELNEGYLLIHTEHSLSIRSLPKGTCFGNLKTSVLKRIIISSTKRFRKKTLGRRFRFGL